MLFDKSEEELRSIARNSIENLEKWARYLISREMTMKYGDNFLYKQNENGDYIIKKEIRDHVQKMQSQNQKRFPKEVDTLFMEQIVSILCKEELYQMCFKKCLDYMYPDGRMEARTYLDRIISIRNCLSHSNSISYREVEQAVCYSNDFVEGVKIYMKEQGENEKYNVPNIIRINDSLGNEWHPHNNSSDELITSEKLGIINEFYCGDEYSIWATMDSSYDEDEYEITWKVNGVQRAKGIRLNHKFREEDVNQNTFIEVYVVSTKKWHKYRFYDHRVSLWYRVLPPTKD